MSTSTQEQVVPLAEAVRLSREFLAQLVSREPNELLVEEVDSAKDVWRITLSFPARYDVPKTDPWGTRQPDPISVFPSMRVGPVHTREVKSVEVNKRDGSISRVKRREPI